MKIPVEWLKQYIKTDKTAKQLAESFTSLGLMLDKPVFKYTEGSYETEVLDLEHRMDRSDWLAILGCARDLAAYDNIELIYPELYTKEGKLLPESEKVKIEVECTDLVKRFNTRVFKGVKVGPSPKWMQDRLKSYGIPAINNIVDITNYVMVELGQPMHAQDLSKMEKREIVIRRGRVGESLTTLLGETLKLDNDCFVLTQNDKPTVLGGIVGTAVTGVDETTTDIVLDAGNYDQVNVRKSSRRFKIANETVLRSDKFLHPALTQLAIQRATKLILDIAGGEYYENQDWYPNPVTPKEMKLRYSRVYTLGGFEIEERKIQETLERLEYKVIDKEETGLILEIPYFRTDIEVEDDMVADVLRIYGYSNIPNTQVQSAPPKEVTPIIYTFEEKLRDILVTIGLHEHVTDPLVAINTEDKTQVKLENSQSQLKGALRTSIYQGLVQVATMYFKHKKQEAILFDIGKTYSVKGNGDMHQDYSETRVTQVYYQSSNLSHYDNSLKTRALLDSLLKNIGIQRYELVKEENNIKIKTENVIIGELKYDSFYLLNTELLKLAKPAKRVIAEFIEQSIEDISAYIDTSINLGEVVKFIQDKSLDVKNVECLPQDIKAETNKKAVLIKVTIQGDKAKTTKIIEEIRTNLANTFKIVLR